MPNSDRYHGEFKTPGGKLIQVDFRLSDDRLVDVEVSGDFFLYPEEALDAITAALEGSSRDFDRVARTAMIAEALPDETEWLGSSPEALAIAVERALNSDG
jgi:lipoate-protein ligase A